MKEAEEFSSKRSLMMSRHFVFINMSKCAVIDLLGNFTLGQQKYELSLYPKIFTESQPLCEIHFVKTILLFDLIGNHTLRMMTKCENDEIGVLFYLFLTNIYFLFYFFLVLNNI